MDADGIASDFTEESLPGQPDYRAPDGSQVRLLCQVAGGGMAHFALEPGLVSHAVVHRSVDEIWYVLGGSGTMWRKSDTEERLIDLRVGTSLTIPVGTRFQFRSTGSDVLEVIGVTMPRWPGPDEAVPVDGRWQSSGPQASSGHD